MGPKIFIPRKLPRDASVAGAETTMSSKELRSEGPDSNSTSTSYCGKFLNLLNLIFIINTLKLIEQTYKTVLKFNK